MKRHGEVVRTLFASLLAATVLITPILAEEPFGVITQVTLDSKKVTLLTKGGETLELETTASTEIVTGKGKKINLEAVAKGVSKAIEDGQKGVFAKVTHEKMVASRITVGLPDEKKAK